MFESQDLAQRVAAGASMETLARELGVDRARVRRELAKAGLVTARQTVLARASAARERGETEVVLDCPRHDATLHRADARGTFRCPACSAARVSRHRRTVKDKLVDEAGGACRLCGYARCARALSFHHLDPSTKSFGPAVGGVSRSLEKARAEAAKCVLLCANCHMEVETGVREVPLECLERSGVTQWQSS